MPLQYQFPLAGDKIVKVSEHGLDYKPLIAEPIPAIADGYIVHMQNTKSRNKIIVVSHDDGFYSLYGEIIHTPTNLIGSPIYRNQMLTKSTDKFNLLIMDSKYGWISGKTYNPLEFIKGRLKPSTRSGGLKGYHIDFPTIQNLEGMREAFLKKSFMRASDTDDKIYVAIQMLVSNFTAPISFDGVLGRYSAVGIQRFINARGGDIEVNGIISKDVWNIFVNLL